MPELLVFIKMLALGFIGAEVYRAAYYLGSNFAPTVSELSTCARISGIIFVLLLSVIYAEERGAFEIAKKLARSFRLDLLAAIGIGAWASELASTSLSLFHTALKNANPQWAPTLLAMFCLVFLSPIIQKYRPKKSQTPQQLYFINDDEIQAEEEDVFGSKKQAKLFAETVLSSGAHSGLVFGLDGPWGVGKTSFINLAQRHWEEAHDKVIVCRFEPLRYVSDPDLADRLIRDLSASIQEKVYAPEFRPAASRYSRLIKGKADISFLGFKLSLEPSQETVDELLSDIDEALKRINRRVIIVVDDLDRLDAKTTNSVLFATRRTFKLSQATYVLCYDTEILIKNKDDDSRAREFLEKFVTVKFSLFVDSTSIRDFLCRDWQRIEKNIISVPADTMMKFSTILGELANILDGKLAAHYMPLIGDLRKIKRFINAMLLMQLEKSDLGRTDFNPGDLINLILLHLNFPGLFRRIYAEETEGRCGIFSIRRGEGNQKYANSPELGSVINEQQNSARFLLTQLFDLETLGINGRAGVSDSVEATRACFNKDEHRNLEGYLKLIVRFATPLPQHTFILYQNAVAKVRKGTRIDSILTSTDFLLEQSDHAHDQFWKALINQSYDLTLDVAEDSINTLIDYLPLYSSVDCGDRSLRKRSIYSLLWLLNYAGWGKTPTQRRNNTAENIIEIAWRIFGDNKYSGQGIIQRLASNDRGILGWNDLMIFRLQSSADRQGQLFNLTTALIVEQDSSAPTTGLTNSLAQFGMRRFSQEVFALFKHAYITPKRNFILEVDTTPDNDFFGNSPLQHQKSSEDSTEQNIDAINKLISIERSTIKSFVIYQLSNSHPPTGSGVGCGFYDEQGAGDGGSIAEQMNDYIFDVCFNPNIDKDNVLYFLDHCLMHLSSSFFAGTDQPGYFATRSELHGGLDPKRMGQYWNTHKDLILGLNLHQSQRAVTTSNYIAFYSDDLNGVYEILDEMAQEVATPNEPSETPPEH